VLRRFDEAVAASYASSLCPMTRREWIPLVAVLLLLAFYLVWSRLLPAEREGQFERGAGIGKTATAFSAGFDPGTLASAS
jgi:hypothetical protein